MRYEMKYTVPQEMLYNYILTIKALNNASMSDYPNRVERMDERRRKAHNKIIRDFSTFLEKGIDKHFDELFKESK